MFCFAIYIFYLHFYLHFYYFEGVNLQAFSFRHFLSVFLNILKYVKIYVLLSIVFKDTEYKFLIFISKKQCLFVIAV